MSLNSPDLPHFQAAEHLVEVHHKRRRNPRKVTALQLEWISNPRIEVTHLATQQNLLVGPTALYGDTLCRH